MVLCVVPPNILIAIFILEYNEDLDIGVNEAPVTSYPLVQIGEVAAGGAYRCSDAG